jgi:hypothetical protein
MSIQNCRLIELPKIFDPRGNLSFIEGKRHIPFEIKRTFYMYDIIQGEERGGHAHNKLEQFIIAMSGTFDVVIDDGFQKKKFTLDKPYTGLYMAPLTWCNLNNFSSGAVCMVLASDYYDEADYYRDYNEFLTAVKKGGLKNNASTIS